MKTHKLFITGIFFLAFLAYSPPYSVHANQLIRVEPQPLDKGNKGQKTQTPPASSKEKIFHAESFTLENGLEIVVISNHRTPVVTHMIWYKVGAADETPGKSGIAHFLEHLMFKGSGDLKPGEFSEIVRSLGGTDNAFTGQDYTAYHQSVPVEHLETMMKMEAGRMRGLNPPAEEVASENKVILEERRQRTDNNPQAQLGEQIAAALFIHHPYGTPVIGWLHEMAELNWQDAKEFYDRWYGPNNAILVVSGDVTGDQVYALAKKHYGPLARIDVPERKRTTSPPMRAHANITMRHPVVREAVVQTVYRVPSYRQDKEAALALQVLEEIMGGGPTSRLYKSLVVDRKIATSAGFSYSSGVRDDGQLYLYATPAPGQKPEDIEKALSDELRKLMKDGVSEQELNDAIQRMQADAIYARDSLSGPARIFGSSLVLGAGVDDVEYWPYNIAQVTAERIKNTARAYLDPDNPRETPPVTGYLLPENPAASHPSEETAE